MAVTRKINKMERREVMAAQKKEIQTNLNITNTYLINYRLL